MWLIRIIKKLNTDRLRKFLKKYLEDHPNENLCDVQDNFYDKLEPYTEWSQYRIIFVNCPIMWSNAALSANSFFRNTIIVNALWTAHLYFYDNNQPTKDAFIMTIGHEEGHKNFMLRPRNLLFYLTPCTTHKFINWVNEVYADYYGIYNKFDGNINAFEKATNYKLEAEQSGSKKHGDSFSHPSWETRIRYASKSVLNRHLIEEIAKDTKCKNEAIIAWAIKKVPEIKLRSTD